MLMLFAVRRQRYTPAGILEASNVKACGPSPIACFTSDTSCPVASKRLSDTAPALASEKAIVEATLAGFGAIDEIETDISSASPTPLPPPTGAISAGLF